MNGRSTAHRGVARPEWVEIGGQRFYARSQAERRHAEILEVLRLAGRILSWEHEPAVFVFDKAARGPRSYKPDFMVTYHDGVVEYHEVKGYMDPRSLANLRAMARWYPDRTVIVFGKMTDKQRDLIAKSRIAGLRAREKEARRRARMT